MQKFLQNFIQTISKYISETMLAKNVVELFLKWTKEKFLLIERERSPKIKMALKGDLFGVILDLILGQSFLRLQIIL